MNRKESSRIKTCFARGGTSRGLIFERSALPTDAKTWPSLFARALGSPDTFGNQLNGVGSGYTSSSKVVVLSPSTRSDADVDYHFFQVDPRSGNCSTHVNCGNMSAAAALYSSIRGWRLNHGVKDTVRMFNVNSAKLIRAEVPVSPTQDLIDIAGVAGTSPAIRLSFLDPAGSLCRVAFPSGHRKEILRVPGLGDLEVTLIDTGIPTVVVAAADFNVLPQESVQALQARSELVTKLEALRVSAAIQMRVSTDLDELRSTMANVPDVALVCAAVEGSVDVRFFSGGAIHRSAPVTSSLAVASACFFQGTILSKPLTKFAITTYEIRHPAGSSSVDVEVDEAGSVASASILRTARLLMEGYVLLG